MTDVNQWDKMNFCVLRTCFTDNLFLTSGSTPESFPIFSISTAAFAAGIFIAWGIGINLWTKLQCCSELFPFPAIWSSWWVDNDSPIRSLCRFASFQMHVSFDLISLVLSRVSPYLLFFVLQGIAGVIGVSNFTRAFLIWFLWISCPQGQWNKFLVIFWHYRVSVIHWPIYVSPSA